MRLVPGVAIATAVMALTPSLSATPPFELFNLSCGGYGNPPNYQLGERLMASNGRIYQHELGTNYPPTPEAIAADPTLEFDSYIAVGGSPSTLSNRAMEPWSVFCSATDGHFAPNYYTQINNDDWLMPLSHDWAATFPFGGPRSFSAPGPSGNEAVFIARITLDRDRAVFAPKLYVGIRDSTTRRLAAYWTSANGPSIYFDPTVPMAPATRPPGVWIQLKCYLSAQVDIPGFGPADVYDVYVESVAERDEPWTFDPENPSTSEDLGHPDEPNDNPAQSVLLQDRPRLQTLNDDWDYFRFQAPDRGRVTFETEFLEPDTRAELWLFSPTGRIIGSIASSDRIANISGDGNPGPFVVGIRRIAGSGRYTVHAFFTPDAPADTNSDRITDEHDLFNILFTWGAFIPNLGPDDLNADLNGDYRVGPPDLEIALRAMGFQRAEHSNKAWKQAMKSLYATGIRPAESFPAGSPARTISQHRKLSLQRLIAASP